MPPQKSNITTSPIFNSPRHEPQPICNTYNPIHQSNTSSTIFAKYPLLDSEEVFLCVEAIQDDADDGATYQAEEVRAAGSGEEEG